MPDTINNSMAKEFIEYQRELDSLLSPAVRAGASHFPAKYGRPQMAPIEKAQHAARHLGVQLNVTRPFTDKDEEVVDEKLAATHFMGFDDWAGETFLANATPAEIENFKKHYPEYFKARQDQIEKSYKLKAKVDSLLLHGAQEKKDYWTLYRLATDGDFRDQIQDIEAKWRWRSNVPRPQGLFQRGLFSAWRDRHYRSDGHLQVNDGPGALPQNAPPINFYGFNNGNNIQGWPRAWGRG